WNGTIEKGDWVRVGDLKLAVDGFDYPRISIPFAKPVLALSVGKQDVNALKRLCGLVEVNSSAEGRHWGQSQLTRQLLSSMVQIEEDALRCRLPGIVRRLISTGYRLRVP